MWTRLALNGAQLTSFTCSEPTSPGSSAPGKAGKGLDAQKRATSPSNNQSAAYDLQVGREAAQRAAVKLIWIIIINDDFFFALMTASSSVSVALLLWTLITVEEVKAWWGPEL